MNTPNLDLKSLIMLLCLAAVWGGSFFFAEIALQEVPPMTITLHRVFWALPLLFILIRFKGLTLPRGPKIWLGYLGMGALNNAIPFTLIFWAQQQIDSGIASILNGTTAMFGAVVAGVLLKDEPLTRNKIAGAVIGLVGVAVIMGPEAVMGLNPGNLAQFAVILGALSYAFASAWGKIMLAGQPPMMNAFGMVCGTVLLMIPLVLLVEGVPSVRLSLPVWGALWGIAALSTVLAYVLYFAILVRAGAANLMLVTLLIPPFAIGLGALFLGEMMVPAAWLGFAIIAVGFAVSDGRLLTAVRRGVLTR